MQSSRNTNKNSALLKKFNTEFTLIAIAFLLATVGLFYTSYANADDLVNAEQVASIVTNHHSHGIGKEETRHIQSEGSVKSTAGNNPDSNSKIGGFSRTDGAMMGAYGDGEYGE